MYRIIVVILWALLIFIFTCSARMEDIFETFTILFKIIPNPDLTELFSPIPKDIGDEFIIRKIGHGVCFFIFTLLLSKVIANKIKVFILSILYAGSTEFFQLFFSRDGRLFDIGFDTLGVVAALFFISLPKQISLTRKNQT